MVFFVHLLEIIILNEPTKKLIVFQLSIYHNIAFLPIQLKLPNQKKTTSKLPYSCSPPRYLCHRNPYTYTIVFACGFYHSFNYSETSSKIIRHTMTRCTQSSINPKKHAVVRASCKYRFVIFPPPFVLLPLTKPNTHLKGILRDADCVSVFFLF